MSSREMHQLEYDYGFSFGGSGKHKKRIGDYFPGRDPGNCGVRCSCGWAYSSSYLSVRGRAVQHHLAFRRERLRWNDPERKANMPSADCDWTEFLLHLVSTGRCDQGYLRELADDPDHSLEVRQAAREVLADAKR